MKKLRVVLALVIAVGAIGAVVAVSHSQSEAAVSTSKAPMPQWLHDTVTQLAGGYEKSSPTSLTWALSTRNTIGAAIGLARTEPTEEGAADASAQVPGDVPLYVAVLTGSFRQAGSTPPGLTTSDMTVDDAYTWMMVVVNPETQVIEGIAEGTGVVPGPSQIPGMLPADL